jgi:3-hydroxyisobutyrate dehydrogenase-like beta-hydroxyacid dehydrogenase
MGAALGSVLQVRGHVVLWTSSGRSAATVGRAEVAGLRDAGTIDELARRSDVIVSVCPPHAALEVARSVSGFDGVYVDANAVSPDTSRAIEAIVEAGGAKYVDGGIIGGPPSATETTRLYLSGALAAQVADLFRGTTVDARVLSERIGDASALKMTYSAWSKGTAALLLAIEAVARAEGVHAPLLDEWRDSVPELLERSERAARSAARKGWRFAGEMEQIASTFTAADLPSGFHEAAAEVFRRSPRFDGAEADEATLERVVSALELAGRHATGSPDARTDLSSET